MTFNIAQLKKHKKYMYLGEAIILYNVRAWYESCISCLYDGSLDILRTFYREEFSIFHIILKFCLNKTTVFYSETSFLFLSELIIYSGTEKSADLYWQTVILNPVTIPADVNFLKPPQSTK